MAFCTNCGAELEEGVRFCTNCGAPVEGYGEAAPTDDLAALDETMLVAGRVAEPAASSRQAQAAPSAYDAQAQLPPTMPERYPEAGQAPAPARKGGAGKVVGITLGVVAAVLVVGFALFYFLNPLGLTTGIFENSAAAQAAAAEAAQADADAAQAELEAAQAEKEQLQAELDEAQRDSEDSSSSISDDDSSLMGVEGYTVTVPEGYPTVQVGNGGEVLAGSNTRTITTDDLEGMNDWELCVARNEIYARHGRQFQRDDLQEFFNQMPWYSVNPDFSDSEMSKLEIDNANTILALEKERGSQYLN